MGPGRRAKERLLYRLIGGAILLAVFWLLHWLGVIDLNAKR